ncbi:endonuclease [Kitasatospora sp. NPDC005856]|uniref:endonuclease n=1 Tax=Kitasatospora sp. NPDC005856 TaxID=3154566 RepID=UPI0033CD7E72
MTVDTIISRLLSDHGRTYAEQAGITLRDKPAPLYRLLVLTVLCSIRIKADTATTAARELFRAGLRTPRVMADSDWQDRVDALGRAHYVRYDESTATALGDGAQLVLDRWHGDLRRMREQADGDLDALRDLLREVPRIGPVGADIFCREAQAVWPQLRPFFDDRACGTAKDLGLPHTPRGLGSLVPPKDHARLAAALVRVSLSKDAVKELQTV